MAKVLKKNKVSITLIAPAKVQGGAISFPITGGSLDPSTAVANIRHSGGLRFKAGKRQLVTRSFTVRTGKNNVLIAKVGKASVPLLAVDLKKARISRNGLGITVGSVGVSLTVAAAQALSRTFKVKLTKTLPSGEISFPITGGRANTSTFAGSVTHSGGISLTAGATVVQLTDFTINVDGDPDLTAVLNGGDRVSILNLDLSALTTDVTGLNITLGGVSAGLTADAAGALSGAFGAPIRLIFIRMQPNPDLRT